MDAHLYWSESLDKQLQILKNKSLEITIEAVKYIRTIIVIKNFSCLINAVSLQT
jgi:hypothetical protein